MKNLKTERLNVKSEFVDYKSSKFFVVALRFITKFLSFIVIDKTEEILVS